MDWGPVAPACRPLPLTVVLLVITAVSLLQAARDPRGLPSPSGPAPTVPVVPPDLTVDLRDLTGLTSSWAPDTRDLTTLDLRARGLVLRHTDPWDLTGPCMVRLLLTSWTGNNDDDNDTIGHLLSRLLSADVPCQCYSRTTRYLR